MEKWVSRQPLQPLSISSPSHPQGARDFPPDHRNMDKGMGTREFRTIPLSSIPLILPSHRSPKRWSGGFSRFRFAHRAALREHGISRPTIETGTKEWGQRNSEPFPCPPFPCPFPPPESETLEWRLQPLSISSRSRPQGARDFPPDHRNRDKGMGTWEFRTIPLSSIPLSLPPHRRPKSWDLLTEPPSGSTGFPARPSKQGQRNGDKGIQNHSSALHSLALSSKFVWKPNRVYSPT